MTDIVERLRDGIVDLPRMGIKGVRASITADDLEEAAAEIRRLQGRVEVLDHMLEVAKAAGFDSLTAAIVAACKASEAEAALAEISRLRLATNEGSLRVRADRMWTIARAYLDKSLVGGAS